MKFEDKIMNPKCSGEPKDEGAADKVVSAETWGDSTHRDHRLMLQRAKTEPILYKKVYYCARAQKTKPARTSIRKNRGSVRSKKDVCCRYAAWLVEFESEPSKYFFIEIHGHTGHDPWSDPEEVRWLGADKVVEEDVEKLVGLLPPSQILDKLQMGVPTGNYDHPYSRLTIDKIEAIRKRWLRTVRVEADDRKSVDLILQSPEFPELFRIEHRLADQPKFHLGICSDFQAAMLKKFGDVVYLDTVHGMTKYGYLQLTMLVMDEFGHGCPVAFSMLGPTETCEDWELLIRSAFEKAGRAPENTVFMIDNSSVMKAAVGQVVRHGTGYYTLCAFHMMQDINRRLARHIKSNGRKRFSADRQRILGKIKTLRLLNSRETFKAESEKFKKFVAACKFMRDPEQFISYYTEQWEKHAAKWANFGRTSVAHHEQNTNNLIESFFCQLRYRFCRKKRLQRLDDHLNVLVGTVIPKYIRERSNRLNGIEVGHRQNIDRKTDHSVASIIESSSPITIHPTLGIGKISEHGRNYCFSLADLSCTCSNNQHGDVCVHVEAGYKLSGGFTYEALSHARDRINEELDVFSAGNTGKISLYDEDTIEFKALPTLRDEKAKLKPIITNVERHYCTCSMFARIGSCCHLPCGEEHAVGVIPEHVFKVRRFEVEVVLEEDPCFRFVNECNYSRPDPPNAPRQERRCISYLAKATTRCRDLPLQKDEECCQKIQDILRWLDDIHPTGFDAVYTEKDIEREISSGFSRRASDRIQKPLYSGSSGRKRPRSSSLT